MTTYKNCLWLKLWAAVVFLMFITACSKDDKNTPFALEGYWQITSMEFIEAEEEQAEIVEEKSASAQEPTQYFHFQNGQFTYFSLTGTSLEGVQVIEKGFFDYKGNEITFTIDGDSEAVVATWQLSGDNLELLVEDSDGITKFEAIRSENPITEPDDDEEPGDDEPDPDKIENFEELHDKAAEAGSIKNPTSIQTGNVVAGNVPDEDKDAITSEYHYYLKLEKGKTYNVEVTLNKSSDFSNLATLMQYLQIWVSDVPFFIEKQSNKHQFRIDYNKEENQQGAMTFTTNTGYLYINMFRYKSGETSFTLKVTETNP